MTGAKFMSTLKKKVKISLDERIKFSSLAYPIPNTANTFGYVLGSLTIIAFSILAVTGIILAFFYIPDPQQASQSVNNISADYILGFIRSVHWYTAQLVPILIILHLTRIIVTQSYKKPREINWFIGVGLFLVTLGFIFTGTIISWTQEGFEALQHLSEGVGFLGPLGGFLSLSENSTTTLLERIFITHISILPIILIILIGIHLLYIKLHGISPLPQDESTWKEKTKLTFIDHIKVVSLYGIGFLGIISIIAILFPRQQSLLPITGVEVSRPPWLLLSWYPFENIFGIISIIVFPSILILLLLIIPFFDHKKERNVKSWKYKVTVTFIVLFLFFIFIMNLISAIMVPAQHL